METDDKAKTVEDLFARGILINKELLNQRLDDGSLVGRIQLEGDLLVLNKDYLEIISQPSFFVDWHDIDRYRVAAEKERNDELYQHELQQVRRTQLQVHLPSSSQDQTVASLELAFAPRGAVSVLSSPSSVSAVSGASTASASFSSENNFSSEDDSSPGQLSPIPLALELSSLPLLPSEITSKITSEISVIISYENVSKKFTTLDFTKIFTSRYLFIEKILRNRQELQHTTAINRVRQKKERERVSIIGTVLDVGTTKNGNRIIKLEDFTGVISVLFSKAKPDLAALGREIVHDEIIGVSGMAQGEILFADSVVWPDIPESHDLKKGPTEDYAAFISDIHVGSKLFLRDDFQRFIDWMNGNSGTEQQRELSKKIKYLIIPGDAVDGIGIYPGQEEELEIKDISEQYATFASLIRKIPPRIQIILCPGNHDVVHLAEPQRSFSPSFCSSLYSIPNLTLVSNPSLVTIGKTATFSGFDVLLYHGYSFDYFVANVDSIRSNGGYRRSDLIMKFLLKRRHLAPSFRSTPYFPSHDEDPLLIKRIPDFFVTGHIHYCSVANYRGVTMISGSCWQDTTNFQLKLGHEPEPARVPIVNLQTRQVKILKFR